MWWSGKLALIVILRGWFLSSWVRPPLVLHRLCSFSFMMYWSCYTLTQITQLICVWTLSFIRNLWVMRELFVAFVCTMTHPLLDHLLGWNLLFLSNSTSLSKVSAFVSKKPADSWAPVHKAGSCSLGVSSPLTLQSDFRAHKEQHVIVEGIWTVAINEGKYSLK